MPISATRTGVLLVDEEVVVRAGLRLLINSWPTLQVIGEADNPAQALAAMAAVKPHVIVCSYARGSVAFLEDLRVVVERADEIPVVVLTSSRYPQSNIIAMQTGVDCVVSKRRSAVELREVLEQLRVRRNGAGKSNGRTSPVLSGDQTGSGV